MYYISEWETNNAESFLLHMCAYSHGYNVPLLIFFDVCRNVFPSTFYFFYCASQILTADVSVGSKMSRKLTLENVITFTKLTLVISFSWPLPATAAKRQIVRFKLLRFLTYVNIWCLFVPLFMTLQDWNDRPDICIKSIPLIAGCVQAFIEMSICHRQHKHFQVRF